MKAIPFDRSVLKVNQTILMVGLVAGYIVGLAHNQAAIVLPVLALMMLAGVLSPMLNVPRLLYLHALKPLGVVKPRVVNEDPAPHRFAQLLGGIFLVGASVAALAGALVAAWVLAWIVVLLAFLNFAFNICVGCIMYAQLVRLWRAAAVSRFGDMTLLALAPLIAIAIVGGVALALRAQRRGQRVLLGQVVETVRRRGAPSILYFTGEACTICHTAQEPALRALAAALDGSVDIREVDVAIEPALARRYRVMSLPTTIVLDGEQTIRHINVGFAAAPTLRSQLIEAGLPVAA